MPNPVPAEYTVQLGPTVTPEVAGELAAWAAVQRRSVSRVTRECIEAGLEVLRSDFRAQDAAAHFDDELLATHVAAAAKRGDAQVSRRRDYDDRTRGGGASKPAKPAKRARTKRSAA